MATRRGKFGRLPRAQPSITSTIVSIAREMQNQRDQNIMDAWKNGGSFEGKPVTDEMMIAHWQQRLAGVSKSDPLYDTYSNAVLQTQYSVEESKVTADYSKIINPTAADDTKVANFYLSWANKVPKDSEFYRTLQRDAAQFLRSAAGRQKAAASAAAATAYQNKQDATEKAKELPGQLAMQVLTNLAQANGIIGVSYTGDPSQTDSKTNIDNMQLPGIDALVAVLAKAQSMQYYSGGMPIDNSTAVLWHDPTGKAFTVSDLNALMKSVDPSYSGTFSLSYIQSALTQQKAGLQQRIAYATSTGHTSDATALQGQLWNANRLSMQVAAMPVLEAYTDLKSQMDAVMANNDLLPVAKLNAISSIRAKIGALANDPSIATNDNLRARLTGEAQGTAGIVTVQEDLNGTAGGYLSGQNSGNSQVEDVNAIVQQLTDTVALTQNPQQTGYVMTQGQWTKVNNQSVFQPSLGGSQYGPANWQSQVMNLQNQGAGAPVQILVPNGDGGGSTQVWVVPMPVCTKATLPDGTTVNPTNVNPVSSFVRYTLNGVTTTLYKITDTQTGQTRWSQDPPWGTDTGARAFSSGMTMTVDITGTQAFQNAVTAAANSTGDGDLGGGFVITGTKLDGSGGKLGYDPAATLAAVNPPRYLAGSDPYTDSWSPTLAGALGQPDEPAILHSWSTDPAFKTQLTNDAYTSAGLVMNPATGQWTDPNPNQNIDEVTRTLDAKVQGALNAASSGSATPLPSWDRDKIDNSINGAVAAYGPQGSSSSSSAYSPSMLPLDLLASQGDTGFLALHSSFTRGTNIPTPPTVNDGLGSNVPQISTGVALKVPTVNGSTGFITTPASPTVTPTATPTTTPTTTPSVTGTMVGGNFVPTVGSSPNIGTNSGTSAMYATPVVPAVSSYARGAMMPS